jgi:hypothetical protein
VADWAYQEMKNLLRSFDVCKGNPFAKKRNSGCIMVNLYLKVQVRFVGSRARREVADITLAGARII